MRTISFAIATAALLFAAPASAQTAQQRAACQGDFKKLCPGVVPGGGRPLACLSKQKDKLSDACKKVVESQGK